MRFYHWLVGALALLALSPALAQSHEGRWALRAGGQTVFLLELKSSPGAPGGWSGSLTRPRRFQMSGSNVVFSDVQGPIVKEDIRIAMRKGDLLELTVGSDSSSESDTYTWRILSPEQGQLGWKHVAVAPLLLSRAKADETVSSDWDPQRSYPVVREWPSNPEMAEIFKADQAARQDPTRIDWTKVAVQDEARRARTKALLDAGALKSGDDFWHAAFVFQHGGKPEDYLLAHTLAMVAAARGRPDATWIGAATLDRYLQSVGQKQVYGTQYSTPAGQATTQEPYDRALVSDALRQALGVPSLGDQEKRRAEIAASHQARESAKSK